MSAQLTYQILAGRKVGLRGQSHQIAVLLGLKPGLLGEAGELRFSHAPLKGDLSDISQVVLGTTNSQLSPAPVQAFKTQEVTKSRKEPSMPP